MRSGSTIADLVAEKNEMRTPQIAKKREGESSN
jgi:hypothetical protein